MSTTLIEEKEMGEITKLLEDEKERLERELTKEERSSRELETKFSELRSVSFWENPFGFFNRKFVQSRAKNLKEYIAELRQKIEECPRAQAELRKGIHCLAIELLGEIANRFYSIERFDIMHKGLANTRYGKTLDLREKLIAVSEKKNCH